MAKIKIPETIPVFGQDVKIKLMTDFPNKQELMGLFDPRDLTIHLNIENHNSKAEIMHTLIHEIVHAVCFRVGLKQTSLPQDLEELMAENISTQLTEIFDIRFKK